MASVTGAMQSVLRLMNAQNEQFLDKGVLPWSSDRPRNFAGVAMFMQSREQRHTLSALTDIVTLFDPQMRAQGGPKAPGAPHRQATGGAVYKMRSPLTEYEWPMNISWHELYGNVGDPFTAEGSQKIYDLATKTNRDFGVSIAKILEADIFATPTAEMFTGDAAGQYPLKSIWTGCNVWTEAHGVAGDGLFPAMTNQQGLDPTDSVFAVRDGLGGATQLSETKVSYSQAANNNTTDGHILDRMAYLIDLLKWDGVPFGLNGSEGMTMAPRSIMCSREAFTLYNRTNRAHGELFATISPIGNPAQGQTTFGGVPFITSDSIRNAAIYPDVQRTTGLDVAGAVDLPPVTEFSNEGAAGGYYYFFDPESVNLHLHKDRAIEIGDWKHLDQQNEDLFRRLAKMIGNLHFTRFQTNGILFPSANISGYAAMS